MGFIIGLLTFLMILDCIVLVLLVLIQVPKKEAGAGLAFGGAASDALFGAGSGNVLTKITKYAATIFFVMAIGLSLLQSRLYGRTSVFQKKLTMPGSPLPAEPARGPAPGAAPLAAPAVANDLKIVPQPEATSAPAAAAPAAPATPEPPKK